jgi:hypothetical protein
MRSNRARYDDTNPHFDFLTSTRTLRCGDACQQSFQIWIKLLVARFLTTEHYSKHQRKERKGTKELIAESHTGKPLAAEDKAKKLFAAGIHTRVLHGNADRFVNTKSAVSLTFSAALNVTRR